MASRVVLAATGSDQPGIVAAVAERLAEAGYDIEDSAMTILRGRFSMMLAVAHAERRSAEDLRGAIGPAARDLGLAFHVDEARDATPAPTARAGDRDAVIISVSGANRTGIVARVARLLADRGANITDLETRLLSTGPVPVYVMQIEAEASSLDLEALRAALDSAGREIGVDVRVDRLETVDL